MDIIQLEKISIQKREKTAITAFSLLGVIAFIIAASLFLRMTRVTQTIVPLNGSWLVLSSIVLFLLIFGLGTSQLGPYMQRTQRRKQHWLNKYGRQVHAVVSKFPKENALIIGESIHGRGTSYMRYLHWQDAQTAQLYSVCVNARFSSALRSLPEGALYPVQFDPDDLSFFVLPEK